jgi:hypothetical protein
MFTGFKPIIMCELALARFKAWVGLIDDVHTALTTYQTVFAVTVFK